jgi:hypothetical protein
MLVFSCKNSEKNENIIIIEEQEKVQVEKESKLINEKIKQSCTVESASKELLQIIEYLESLDYKYEVTLLKDDLTFSYRDWGTLEIAETITYLECNYIEYFFKKKTPLKGSFYPKFSLIELCFETPEKAKIYFEKITHIINRQEKNYGYLLLNNDKLIYVQTGVNMYSFIIKDFKDELKKIIKNVR